VLLGRTGQDDRQTINSEVQLVFRKKTRGQVIGAELQEAFAHIGVAASEAGHLAAEQLGPRVTAAREAAGPAFDAAQKAAALKVAPKVAAAVAAAAPAVSSAREAITPRMDAARDSLGPRVEAAREALAPRIEAARQAAAPRVASAVSAAQEAAVRAAADLGPRVEAAQKTLRSDVVPRLESAQAAAVAYAVPRVAAARVAVTPALDSARETLAAGVESALSEIEARRAELAASAEKSGRKARKSAKKARKAAGKKRREFAQKAALTAKQVQRKTGVQPSPRRWPWVLVALAAGTAVFAVLRRSKDDSWTPAPTGDGPVPSYREDPVPGSDSNSGKTVSTAMETASDSAPNESDMGERDAQMVQGDDPGSSTTQSGPPEPFTSGGGSDAGPTAGPADKQV
jgi:hypothetical protein